MTNKTPKRQNPFTLREYLEFTGVEEFRKFKNCKPITREDIVNTDWETLLEWLQTA